MKAAIGSVVVAAALLVAPAAWAQSTTSGAKATTSDSLDSRIEKRINDSSLKAYNIRVSVNDGVATLTGTVRTEADRLKATDLAKISGVTRVDNQILVDPAAKDVVKDKAKGTAGAVERGTDKAADKTKEGVDKAAEGVSKAAEKTQEGVEKGWEKSKEGAAKAADKGTEGLAKAGEGIAKAGEAVTDAFIKTRVKSKFVDEDLLKDSDIEVDVNDHVVTLSGVVPSEAGRARAIEEAKKVDGVHQVIDRMRIGTKK